MSILKPIQMEWAVDIEGGPGMRDWDKLSEFQANRVRAGDPMIWLQHGLGASFKMRRVHCDNMIMFEAATRHAAEILGGKNIILRDIVPKLVKFEKQALQKSDDGFLEMQAQGSLSGSDLCLARCAATTTVAKLRATISNMLYEKDLKTLWMPVFFTDDFIKDVSGMRKLQSVFHIINGKVKKSSVDGRKVKSTIKK